MSELLTQLPSFGVAGLLFVMWWFERQDRLRSAQGLRDALESASRGMDVNKELLDVIRQNTEALAALREELRSHRAHDCEALMRLTQQLQRLAG